MKNKVLVSLRWFVAVLFLLMGTIKLYYLSVHGFSEYGLAVSAVGLPEIFKYYGLVAMFIEFALVVGLWWDKLYKKVLILTLLLSGAGAVLSVYFIIFKVNSDCGCGLLGDNEYALLVQKLVLLILLTILYKNKNTYFNTKSSIVDI